MSIKVTVPNNSSDSLIFGSANTTNASQVTGIDSGSSNGQLAFYTTASGVSTERMRIDSSGNVGIGTNSPSFPLDVAGAIRGNSWIGRANTSAPTADAAIYRPADNSLGFSTANTERMRIDSSGSLLVGATATGAYFDGNLNVFKSAALPASIKTDSSGTYCLATWNSATSGNNLFQAFITETSPTVRGNIDYNRAGTAVRYNTTSDQRLKENITDSLSALPLIGSIKIRSFDWKETGFHVEHGVIAQELEQVVPDAVSVGEDNEDGTVKRHWAVDTSVLVPTLVKAIQELKAELDTVKTELATLKGQA